MSEVKYLSNDGFCYLSYWYGDNENIVNIFYFDKNSKEVLNFKIIKCSTHIGWIKLNFKRCINTRRYRHLSQSREHAE